MVNINSGRKRFLLHRFYVPAQYLQPNDVMRFNLKRNSLTGTVVVALRPKVDQQNENASTSQTRVSKLEKV